MADERQKPKTISYRMGFSSAPRYDESPQTVTIMDSNNVVLSPDGSEMRSIPGSVITNTYKVATNPVGRKAIVRETNPHDVDQRMYMINNTRGGQNRIECIEFGRNLGTNVQSQQITVSWTSETLEAPVGAPSFPTFLMTGPPLVDFQITAKTYDGTAIAGTDYFAYPAFAPVMDFNTSANPGDLTVEIKPGATAGRYFYLELVPISQSVVIGPPTRLFITIVP